MEELNTPIFAQAKVEYTAQLIDILYPHMFDGVKSIYDESKILYRSRNKTPVLLIFRELLEKVPIWNNEIIESECSRITNNSNCDYIDDLITAVFISHTKILTSIGPNQSFNKINVTIPKCSTFIHKSYINTARELWKNPYLFNESIPGHEFQKNNKEIENIIKTCIENTIRNLLPIKEILKEHLEGETDSILNQKETLKQLLREELNELKSNKIIVDSYNSEVSEAPEELDEHDESEYQDKLRKQESIEEADGPIIIREDDTIDTSPEETAPEETAPEEDNLSDLEDKLTQMVEKMEEESKIEDIISDRAVEKQSEEPSMSELFPSSNDPTEEQVAKQCSDIVVNDITVPVEIPGMGVSDTEENNNSNHVVEIKYDNVDINSSNPTITEDPERLKRLITNMEFKEEVNVVKSDEIATPNQPIPEPEPQPQPSFSLNSLYPGMNNTSSAFQDNSDTPPKVEITHAEITPTDPAPPLQIIKEDKPVTDNNTIIQEPKSPRKEMVAVKNEDDIDETSSLANFFDDMKKIVEDKGIKVEKNDDKMFTLFEDANEVEKL
jgi:hypothetical protein